MSGERPVETETFSTPLYLKASILRDQECSHARDTQRQHTAPAIRNLPKRPRVLVVGGGFAGLSAVTALAHMPVDVTLIDRRNHHTFQPLLYQVALAVLSPAEIAQPLRSIVSKKKTLKY